MSIRSFGVALVALVALAVGSAGDAFAATMSKDGSALVYRGDEAKENQLSVYYERSENQGGEHFEGGAIVFQAVPKGGNGPSAPAGCREFRSRFFLIYCARAGVTAVRVVGGDLHDTVNAGGPVPVTVTGGNGPDRLFGHETGARVIVRGEAGNDTLRAHLAEGGPGADDLEARPGGSTLRGGAGNDRAMGHYRRDRLFGNAGNDELYGRAGDDVFDGGRGRDLMVGAAGDDRFFARDGIKDVVRGMLGRDRARLDDGLDDRAGIEATF